MRLIRPITAFAALAACSAVAATPASAAPAQGTARQFEGTVVSVNVENRTFRLRDAERGTVRIRVTASTRFERLSGLRALRPGMRNIESRVRRSGGAWVAIEVERSGGGGSHGGDNRGGRPGDDSRGRGRGGDDPAGDDNGGQRPAGVSDDPAGDDNGGQRPAGVSDDPPGDDNGGDRPEGVSDDPPGDDSRGRGRGED